MKNIEFSTLTGKIITKEDGGYNTARVGWNRAIDMYPLVIIYCSNKKDIINGINFAKKYNKEIRIRSGAHHYEGFSNGNDVVVIDVSNMNSIIINEENNEITIEAGARNREVYEAVGEVGYIFPGGGCPTVGVVGLTLGAGWGYSSRYLGLAAQSLKEIELINYNGNILVANNKQNSDLFWACKGAGAGNFGIVTKMIFNLNHKINKGTLITIDYPNISLDDNIKVIQLCQREFKNMDRRINMKISNYNSIDKGRGVRIIGIFYGDENECRNIINPFINILNNRNIKLEYMEISKINTIIQDSHPDYESYKSTGRFVCKSYSYTELKELLSILKERPIGSIYTAISLYGLGGKVEEWSKEDGAFIYKDAQFILGFQSVWEDNKYINDNNHWFIDKFRIIKEKTNGSFVNFPLKELENYKEEYFGSNSKRLSEVKEKYDPKGVFDFPQGI